MENGATRRCPKPSQQEEEEAVNEGRQFKKQQRNDSRNSYYKPTKLNIPYQIALCAIFLGSQISVEFDGIYTVLSLQYLGLPVSFLFIYGTVSGLFGMLAIPVIGAVSDSGDNPRMRKVKIQVVTLFLFLTCYGLLITSCLVKQQEVASTLEPINQSNLSISVDNSYDSIQKEVLDTNNLFLTNNSKLNYAHTAITGNFIYDNTGNSTFNYDDAIADKSTRIFAHTTPETSSPLPIAAILGLIAATLLQFAYDMSMSLPRGMIIECVPDSQKRRVIATGTSLSSLAGVIIGVLGTLDLPGYLGHEFNMDGVSASLILICSCLIVITLVTFTSTIITVKVLQHRNTVTSHSGDRVAVPSQGEPMGRREKLDAKLHETSTLQCTGHQNYGYLKCLELSETNDMKENEGHVNKASDVAISYQNDCSGNSVSFHTVIREGCAMPSGCVDDIEESNARKAFSVHPYCYANKYRCENGSRPERPTCNESNLSPSSQDKHNIGLDHHTIKQDKTKSDKNNTHGTSKKKLSFKGYPLNKRFIMTLISAFLTFGSSMTGTTFSSNTLTLEVLQGDPHATPGSPARDRYDEGIRMASFGSLLLGLTYLVISLLNRKLMEKIDNAGLIGLCSLLLAGACTLFYLVPSLPTYFFMMACLGANKCMGHIIPFVLALKYADTNNNTSQPSGQDEEETAATAADSKVGRVTSLVGSLLPLNYLVMSSIMGPAMDALGNAWVPVWYVIALSSLNCLVTSLLVFKV